jgi:hypothetical protein
MAWLPLAEVQHIDHAGRKCRVKAVMDALELIPGEAKGLAFADSFSQGCGRSELPKSALKLFLLRGSVGLGRTL